MARETLKDEGWIDCRGIKVRFPFVPYDCQRVYMEKVMECLSESKNGILESPTGTGKTLCLLCAALAWRENYLSTLKDSQAGADQSQCPQPSPLDTTATWTTQSQASDGHLRRYVPRIIYASRTHSQLTQVMRELKNTAYQVKVAVIGSRDQLCIHQDVLRLDSNSDKVQMCRSKVHSRSCQFYNNFDGKKEQARQIVSDSVLDIEDLAKFGSAHSMCPYYMSRELKKTADVIFMPYNYILDVKNRRAHGIDLHGAILIVDEAHNIERVCEESASFDLSTLDLSNSIADVDRLVRYKKGEADQFIQDKDEEELNLKDLEDLINLKKFFLGFEEQLDLACSRMKNKEGKFEGKYIFELFSAAGVTYETADICAAQCERAMSLLNLVSGSGQFRSGSHLQKFLDCLKIVFSWSAGGGMDVQHRLICNAANYRVYLKTEPNKNAKKQTQVWTVPTAADASRKDSITLSYWCFSPGFSMREVVEQGVRCVILTSGTLSPIDSFSSELRVDFPVTLQNPHVITTDHIWLGVVTRGPDQTPLNSSYQHRSEQSYQNSLGNALVNFARVVPSGMLVFFPSYFLMNDCISNWENNGIMERMRGIKDVYTEPRQKTEFKITIDGFYSKVKDPESSGAIFMAVCRGKVSEGLDFADSNGRAVVITGLPYPPRMDPKVTLKMEYLRRNKDLKHIGAEEWYQQQASRAVNQAIGRVIRHKDDFGAILLCDERFNHQKNSEQLPKWLKPHLKVHTTFGMAQRNLNEFFKKANEKFGCSVRQSKQAVETLERRLEAEDTGHIFYRPKGQRRLSSTVEPRPVQSLDVHVPSMVVAPSTSSLPKISLKFDEEKAPLGFFEALSKTQTQSHPKLFGLAPPSSPVSKPVLGKRPVEVCETEGQGSTLVSRGREQSGPSPSDLPPPRKPLSVKLGSVNEAVEVNAKVYQQELKRNLSSEALKTFTSLVTEYKKEKDFVRLKEGLKDLFGNPSLFGLLRGFVKYIRKEQRDAFNEFCYEVTGKSPVGQVELEGLSVREPPMPCTRDDRHEQLSPVLDLRSSKNTASSTFQEEGDKKRFCCKVSSTASASSSSQSVVPSVGLESHARLMAAAGRTDGHLSTASLDSVSLLNGGKPLLGIQPVSTGKGDRPPSLKSRVWGKTCLVCGSIAVAPHQASCGHCACYQCWMAVMKGGATLCPNCNTEVKKKHLKRSYLI